MNTRILLVEDETTLGQTMSAYLQRENYEVQWLSDGAEVLSTFETLQPSLVLLDLMLPNVDGITLCQQIRKNSSVPIIMATARVDELDRLLGLEIGADDYICKPYSPREVIARVKAVLRRCQSDEEHKQEKNTHNSPLNINPTTMEATWQGLDLELTTVEFRLLQAMASEPRRVFSREQLICKIYNDGRIVSDRTVDSHITKLRRKLAKTEQPQEIIRSIYGAGYKFERPL